MTTAEMEREIQKYPGINHILARYVRVQIGTVVTPESVKKVLDEKGKPFVKWVGGKRQLLQQFKDRGLYPPIKFNPEVNTYYEPFVGGGAVFFDLMPRNAVLSDMNAELVTTYNVIKNNVEGLICSLKKHRYEKEYFLKVRAKKIDKLSDVEIASRFIFLNRTCFNGLYRVNSKGEFNVPFGAYENPRICDAENLRRVSQALQHAVIKKENYAHVLERAKKGDFIYFDPPYHPLSATASFTSYTANGFTAEDQVKLRDIFVTLHKRGCFVMLSNSSADFIKKIYNEIKDSKIKINEIDAGRMVNSQAKGRGKVKEVLVINY